MKLKLIVLIGISTLLFACDEDTSELKAIESIVDERLHEYFESFKTEAAARDVIIDFNEMNVEGHISDIAERGIAGQCQTYTDGNKAVVIDETYWNRSSDLKKEFIIFHELGHCILNREHHDEANENGSCVSIMNSGSAGCDLSYTEKTREAFFDELFSNL